MFVPRLLDLHRVHELVAQRRERRRLHRCVVRRLLEVALHRARGRAGDPEQLQVVGGQRRALVAHALGPAAARGVRVFVLEPGVLEETRTRLRGSRSALLALMSSALRSRRRARRLESSSLLTARRPRSVVNNVDDILIADKGWKGGKSL